MAGCGDEAIAVRINGEIGDDFETLVTKAMGKVAEFLPDARICRDYNETTEGDWYVGCVHSQVSQTGQAIAGDITLVKRIG